jgi:hypothetical protein
MAAEGMCLNAPKLARTGIASTRRCKRCRPLVLNCTYAGKASAFGLHFPPVSHRISCLQEADLALILVAQEGLQLFPVSHGEIVRCTSRFQSELKWHARRSTERHLSRQTNSSTGVLVHSIAMTVFEAFANDDCFWTEGKQRTSCKDGVLPDFQPTLSWQGHQNAERPRKAFEGRSGAIARDAGCAVKEAHI